MADDKKDQQGTITRRGAIIGTSAAIGTGILLGKGASGIRSAIAQVKRDPKLQVPRRTLGKTKAKVPILLFGAAVDLDPNFDPKLAAAYRYGVDYIDAAQMYGGGTCESAVGSFQKRAKLRKKVWITSKSRQHEVKGFKKTFANSLKDLETDYIDLYFLHALQKADYLSKDMEKTVAKLKKDGKLRFFGFSCHHGNVAELLHEAADKDWVDVVMFRYNFRQYGDKELNKAMDAAAKAKVGLIAMKTQGSAASFEDEWKKVKKKGKWTKHQAVLKAVWEDDRITAAVSHMDSLEKLRENVAAALNKEKLTRVEYDALDRYAEATRPYACDGCDHICGAAVDGSVQIGDTMRFLMYHDVYGETDKARRLFHALPEAARALSGVNFSGANAACPHGVDVAAHMKRALKVLA
jgi:predicted aldo/keto reductase-like oxidoreductase